MHILLWSEYFLPHIGGIEIHVDRLLPELSARGHQAIVVTTHLQESHPQKELWHGTPVYRLSKHSPHVDGDIQKWMRQQRELKQFVSDFKPQVVHLFSIGASVLNLLLLLKQYPVPLIARLPIMLSEPEVAYSEEYVIGKSLLAASWVTAVSRAVREQAITYLPSIEPRISVLYNGHPAPAIEPAQYPTAPHILFVGRLVEQKRCNHAIAAFAKLHEHYPCARLTIAGDGTERAQLEQQAASLGSAVEFLGMVAPHAVHTLLNTATLLLLPSQWEGLPNVAIEAAFMARPTVASNIPGMSEVVLDGKTGILVEPEDVQGMADAMAFLIDHPDQTKAMGQAAHAWAHQQFTMVRCVDEYEALYARVLAMHDVVPSMLEL